MPARDLAWFTRLAELLEHERRAEAERFVTLQRELTLNERAARGYAVLDLVVAEEGLGFGGRVLLHLERDGGGRVEGRIDSGDRVTLRPRRTELGETLTAVVARRRAGEVVLALDEPPPAFVHSGRLVLELQANEVTYSRARAALTAVQSLCETSSAERKRVDVLLGKTPPRTLRRDMDAAASTLNPEQQLAVLHAMEAQDFYLVHGPPGTGKSTVLAEVADRAVQQGERVLATAASNAAVDHLLELCAARGLRVVRVGHPARVAERLAEYTLAEQAAAHPDHQLAAELFDEAFALRGYARRQRSQGRSAARFSQARSAQADARDLLKEARTLERRAVSAVLDRAQIVCATLANLGSGELERARFDLALLDEATQATEPLTLMAFLRTRRLVMAGDHRQLPPTILSAAAQSGGLGISLFERLLNDHGDGPQVKQLLCEQHRMHQQIMAFPSAQMYDGALRAHPAAAARTLADLLPDATLDTPPLLFIDTAGKGWEEELAPGTESYQNPGEAELVLGRLRALLVAGLSPRDVAVIAPYSAQVALLRSRVLASLGAAAAAELEIDSVDAFQGREKEAVILSLTRSNATGQIGFLADLRRINVAITRARRHLLIVGDSATLGAFPFYEKLLDHVQTCGVYRSAWELTDDE